MLSLLLEVAVAAAVPETTATQSPERTEANQPDWLLYLLTIAAVAAAIHFYRSFANPPTIPLPPRPTPPPSATAPRPQMSTSRDKPFTLAQLAAYNGIDANKPLLLGCLGDVFDVTAGAGFYGPGGPYGVFAGKDASRGLARMEIEYNSTDVSDLTGSQQTTLQEWHDKFESKYPVVGRIVDDSQPNSGSARPGTGGGPTAGPSGGAGATTTNGAMGQTANPLVSSSSSL